MNTFLLSSLSLLIGTFSGFFLCSIINRRIRVKSDNPVLAIFSGVVNDEEKIKLYQKSAIPLAEKAGLELLGASSPPQVLEGEWPFEGFVVIERFSSLEALNRYRNSNEYLEARKLRDASATMNFVICVEDVSGKESSNDNV